jgi:ubiquinone/menaquinone biosynthesis C-methylase UbiE
MAPFMAGLHAYIADHIEPDRKILDAGCGTGDLVLRLAPRAREVLGVELSPAMVEYARKRLEPHGFENVSFEIGDVTMVLAERPDASFDVATLVMALHEMPADTRLPVLETLARTAREVVCVDFRVPMPRNLAGFRNRFFELAAGPEHFGAFRDFNRRGGTTGVCAASGLHCEHVRHLDGGTLAIHRIRRAES